VAPKNVYTTDDVGRICDVSLSTVINWVNTGKLSAYRTPGGHRRITRKNLVEFLKKYKMPVPTELTKDLRKRILIVDDDKEITKMLSRALKHANSTYEVASAYDGFEAGRKLLDFRPDVVILDIMLPGADGFNVCRTIRSQENTKHIKILAITGYDSPEVQQKIIKYGADYYMAKPLELQKFVRKVSVLLKEK